MLLNGCEKTKQEPIKSINYKAIPQSLSKNIKMNPAKFEQIRKTENTISKLPPSLSSEVELVVINETGEIFEKLLKQISDEFIKTHPKAKIKIYSAEETNRIHPNPFSISNEDFNDYADIIISNANNIEEWLYQGYMIPIEPLELDLNNFFPNAFSDVYSNDKIYGVPLFAYGLQLLFYNKDYVKAPPKSLDSISETLADNVSEDTLTFSYPLSYPIYMFPFLLTDKFKNAVNIQDLLSISNNSINNMRAFAQKNKISEAYSIDIIDSLFREGKSAYIINGDWSIRPYSSTLGDKLGISPVPPVNRDDDPSKFLAEVRYAFISSTIRNNPQRLKAVSLFLNHLTNNSSQAYIMKSSTLTSPIKSLLEKDSDYKLTINEKARIEAFSNTITYRKEKYKKTLFKFVEKYLIPITKLEKQLLQKDMIFDVDLKEFRQNLLGLEVEDKDTLN